MRPVRIVLCTAAIVAGGTVHGQGFSPDEAVKRMQLPPGFSAKVVACEPMIRQPVSIEFDNRGRLWVLQYLQYPNPAGLKAVKQDEYLRTVWDRVPEPPPKGPKGADRLTICYDPDETGRFRKSKDFVSGLNLASGFCLGNGGVYVVQPPYLLFYPDKNEDDVPDGDPEVLLSGFGMEDPHAYANSLQWGPDGWLYGAQGSTVTAKIANPANPKEVIEFQQGVWRYHPKTKRFELFAEGGGNIWGLDFDKHGQLIAGTNFGGVAMMHVVQGGYYVKNWTKHGALHNPHAYGFFEHVPYTGFKGGHVTCGGIIYQGGAYPKEYDDQYIAGNLLSNAVYWHKMEPSGSTFKASHGGDFVVANDTWFRPVDLTLGPDGSVYIADWYDKRAAHLDPIDNWDKTNGRVYKIEYQGTKPMPPFDLRTKTSAELVELLKHPNAWWRRQARQLLLERPDSSVNESLQTLLEANSGVESLEALWVLHGTQKWEYSQASRLGAHDHDHSETTQPGHPNEYVRAWAVRLAADVPFTRPTVPTRKPGSRPNVDAIQLGIRLIVDNALISDKSPVVLQTALCSLRRSEFYNHDPFAVIERIARKKTVTSADPFVPNLLWWAVEKRTSQSPDDGFVLLEKLSAGPSSRLEQELAENITRTILARDFRNKIDGQPIRARLAQILLTAKGESTRPILRGMLKSLSGQTYYGVPVDFRGIKELTERDPADPLIHEVLAMFGEASGFAFFRARLAPTNPESVRLQAADVLSQSRDPDAKVVLLAMLNGPEKDQLKIRLLSAIERYQDKSVADSVLSGYATYSNAVRTRIVQLLHSRPEWALTLYRRIESGTFSKSDVTTDQVRAAVGLNEPELVRIVEKLFGKITPATPGEKLARINWLQTAVGRLGKPDVPNGKALFTQHCAACHVLHGEGGTVGPDLTTADRKNAKYMLTQIVDPSAYIRPEYVQHAVTTTDGRKLVGIVSSSAEGITLLNVVDNKPVKTVVPKGQVDDVKPLPTSLMPEKLLDTLTDEQVRDLLGYLASDPPKK
jgi:putative membrane-bound dehydrogenase-like protein